MDSESEGTCCVCGKETTTRCGACETAGFDLFFCSREHQKLIWPVHKLVCGPGKANPFLWPDLTEEEADEAREHIDSSFHVLDTHYPSLPEEVGQIYPRLAQKLPNVLASLASNVPLSPPLPCSTRQHLLLLVRANIFARFHFAPSPDCVGEKKPPSPIQDASGTAASYLQTLQNKYPFGSSWLTPLLHRLVVYSCLMTRMHLANYVEEACRLEHQAETQIRVFLCGELREKEPEAAGTLLQVHHVLAARIQAHVASKRARA